MIGIKKEISLTVLGKSLLNYVDIHTVLCGAENLSNSSPLFYLSDDVSVLVALSFFIFLQKIKDSNAPDFDKVDVAYIRKRY